MKPGDLIEWYYQYNSQPVIPNEKLWSSLMKQWVPIGIISTILHQDEETYSWINSKGCFRARGDDTSTGSVMTLGIRVFPRAWG